MAPITKSYYRDLRKLHGVAAQQALRMARALYDCEQNGVEFLWAPELENPRDVFGEACPNHNCHDPKCRFCHYNAAADHYCVSAELNGVQLASLGMVEDDGRNGHRSYWWLVECELALEAVELITFEEVC